MGGQAAQRAIAPPHQRTPHDSQPAGAPAHTHASRRPTTPCARRPCAAASCRAPAHRSRPSSPAAAPPSPTAACGRRRRCPAPAGPSGTRPAGYPAVPRGGGGRYGAVGGPGGGQGGREAGRGSARCARHARLPGSYAGSSHRHAIGSQGRGRGGAAAAASRFHRRPATPPPARPALHAGQRFLAPHLPPPTPHPHTHTLTHPPAPPSAAGRWSR